MACSQTANSQKGRIGADSCHSTFEWKFEKADINPSGSL